MSHGVGLVGGGVGEDACGDAGEAVALSRECGAAREVGEHVVAVVAAELGRSLGVTDGVIRSLITKRPE